jgi:hypothetical protein
LRLDRIVVEDPAVLVERIGIVDRRRRANHRTSRRTPRLPTGAASHPWGAILHRR